MPLTRCQSHIFTFLCAYIGEHGIAPTLREIATATGVKSLATVHSHLTALEYAGKIERKWNHSRSIVIVGVCPYCGHDMFSERKSA